MTIREFKDAFAAWSVDSDPEALEPLLKSLLSALDERMDVEVDLDRRLRRAERRLELALAPLQDQEAFANRLLNIELLLAVRSETRETQ